MAGAIIPILSAAAPLLMPLAKKLIMGVEHLFGAKTGETKLASVVSALVPIAQQLATAGKIPGTLDTNAIVTLVESLVQDLKAQGILNPDVAATVANAPLVPSNPSAASFKVSGGTLQLQFSS